MTIHLYRSFPSWMKERVYVAMLHSGSVVGATSQMAPSDARLGMDDVKLRTARRWEFGRRAIQVLPVLGVQAELRPYEIIMHPGRLLAHPSAGVLLTAFRGTTEASSHHSANATS